MLQMWSLLCLCAVAVTQGQYTGDGLNPVFPGQYPDQLFPDDYDDGLSGGEIPGIAGSDYPVFAEPPPTRFTCNLQPVRGYYADPEAGCQVFYICQDGGKGTPFLCPNGTVFNQEFLVCDWWYNVDCSHAIDFYVVNEGVVRAMEEVDAANVLVKAQGLPGITGPLGRQLTSGVSPFLNPGALAGSLGRPGVSPFLNPGAIGGSLARPGVSPFLNPGALAGSLGRPGVPPFLNPGAIGGSLGRSGVSPFLNPGALAGTLARPGVSPFLRPGAIASPLNRPGVSPFLRPGAIAGPLTRPGVSPFLRPGAIAGPLNRPGVSPFGPVLGTGLRPGTAAGLNPYNPFGPKVAPSFAGGAAGRLLNAKDSYAPATRYNYPTPEYGVPLPGKGPAPGPVNVPNDNFGNGVGPYYDTDNGDRPASDSSSGYKYPNRNKVPSADRAYLPPSNYN